MHVSLKCPEVRFRFMPAVLDFNYRHRGYFRIVQNEPFQDYLPPFPTRWVIAAPDEDPAESSERNATSRSSESWIPYACRIPPLRNPYLSASAERSKGFPLIFLDCFVKIGEGNQAMKNAAGCGLTRISQTSATNYRWVGKAMS